MSSRPAKVASHRCSSVPFYRICQNLKIYRPTTPSLLTEPSPLYLPSHLDFLSLSPRSLQFNIVEMVPEEQNPSRRLEGNMVRSVYLDEESRENQQNLPDRTRGAPSQGSRRTGGPSQHYRRGDSPEQTDTDFFGLFNCCRKAPEQQPEVYVTRAEASQLPQMASQRSARREEPYMSEIRMRSRQNQPNNIFNDHLVSEKLTQSRWTYL